MADWIEPERFNEHEYGRLAKQPGAIENFKDPWEHVDVPPGGRIVADPKDGRFGIVIDAEGTAICKMVLKP